MIASRQQPRQSERIDSHQARTRSIHNILRSQVWPIYAVIMHERKTPVSRDSALCVGRIPINTRHTAPIKQ